MHLVAAHGTVKFVVLDREVRHRAPVDDPAKPVLA